MRFTPLSYAAALLAAAMVVSGGASLGQQGETPEPAPLGFTLDTRFTPVMQGFPAGSLIELDDGRLMVLSNEAGGTVRVSNDEGKTWTDTAKIYDGPGPGRPTQDLECGLALKTRDGVIVWVYRDMENFHWAWDAETGEAVDPRLDVWSIRSLDGGETWVDRQLVSDQYCGAIQDIMQTSEGNIVVPIQRYVPNPGRHLQCTHVSTDNGATWHRSNIIDNGGHGHHDGNFEGTVVELKDGRLYMLMRTTLGRFWEAYSWDGGFTWRQVQPSNIPASTAPGYITRLASERLVLVWNQLSAGKKPPSLFDLKADPDKPATQGSALPADGWRNSISIAFSDDEAKTWSEPIVFAEGQRLCYPQIWERRPGEIWISFVAGKDWVRNIVKVNEADLVGG